METIHQTDRVFCRVGHYLLHHGDRRRPDSAASHLRRRSHVFRGWKRGRRTANLQEKGRMSLKDGKKGDGNETRG